MHPSRATGVLQRNAAKIFQVLAVFIAGLVLTIAGALLYARVQTAREPIQTIRKAHPEERASLPKDTKPGPARPSFDEGLSNTPSSGVSSELAGPPNQTQESTLTPESVQNRKERGLAVTDGSTSPDATSSQLDPKPAPNEAAAYAPVDNSAKDEGQHASYSRAPAETGPQLPAPPQNTSIQEPILEPRYASKQEAQRPTASGSRVTSRLPEPERKSVPLTIPEGTILTVRLAETLSSNRNRAGDTFRATLASPLAVNGSMVAGMGAAVLGRVVSARRAPLIGGRANLTLTLTHITGAEERLVPVNTSIVEEQGSHTNVVNTAKMATGAVVGAVVGAVRGAGEGSGLSSSLKNGDTTNGFMATNRTVVLPAGTQFIFRLNTALTLN
jgi:hypothetical protein